MIFRDNCIFAHIFRLLFSFHFMAVMGCSIALRKNVMKALLMFSVNSLMFKYLRHRFNQILSIVSPIFSWVFVVCSLMLYTG